MAHQRSTKRNHRLRNAKARRRVIGLSTTAGAFLAFGMTPLAAAPAAHADDFGILDNIFDPILNSLSNIDPTLDTDLSAIGLGSFDPALAGDHAAAVASVVDPAANPAADPASSAQLFNVLIYQPIHTVDQIWITSFFGGAIDNFINKVSGEFLIGNGAPGTEADPDGGAGGLWFGDGGAGWNSTVASAAGGNGGVAYFGTGGAGGMGGLGADGGAGGNTAFGIAGNGGTGGTGVDGGAGGS
ncbi:MAG: PGRS repeat-containing protein, partial [Mycobacterium sp.]